MKNQELYDISIEEFDKMNEKHVFSEKYKKNKQKMLKDYRKSVWSSTGAKTAKVAVACAAVLIASPVVANAASNGELFSRIWGKAGHKDVAAHEETIYLGEDEGTFTASYPERTYEDVNPQKAESLIGDSMSYPNITKEIDGTTITILSVVRDNNSAVIEYTLEKAGGVDALKYSQLDNEAKGAWISEESTFNFSIGNGSTIVDLENSTDEKLYCYEYITLDDDQNYVEMKIEEYPCKLKEIYALDYKDPKREELENQVVSSSTKIPFSSNVVAETTFVNPAGGKIKVSPLSLKVDMSKGFGLSEVQAADPVNCYYVAINYKDGTNYVVMESNADGRHSCDVEKDNTAYSCGTLTGEYVMLFNSLVDTDQISSITVNDVEYTLE